MHQCPKCGQTCECGQEFFSGPCRHDCACAVCGCTEWCGCPEGCYWARPGLCSVCAGITPRRRRHYTRTAAAANRPAVPAGMIGIFNAVGRLVCVAWSICEAQWTCRARDAYMQMLSPNPVRRWRRGAILRRRHLAR